MVAAVGEADDGGAVDTPDQVTGPGSSAPNSCTSIARVWAAAVRTVLRVKTKTAHLMTRRIIK
ncbi:MAG: hypothetical protein RLO49_00645, partial [Rhodospirillales bacterium]